MNQYLEVKKGDKIEFLEDIYYSGKKEMVDVKSNIRCGGITIDKVFWDDVMDDQKEMNRMWSKLQEFGLIQNNEVIIPKGTIATITIWDPNCSEITLENGVKFLIASYFTSGKIDEDDIPVKVLVDK